MKIALFGKRFTAGFYPYMQEFLDILDEMKAETIIYEPFAKFISQNMATKTLPEKVFTRHSDLPSDTDYVISIGGDGTFLDAISFVRDSRIPTIGINSGRLGFLANISKEEIRTALLPVFEGRCSFEERSLICLETENKLFGDFNFALNELTIHKKDSASMITVHAYINDKFLNTYWADGLIISTPTGSTAYSLSVGGPIVAPESKNFIIAPIAPHNLTVRPIVVTDSNVLRFKVEGRNPDFLASLDHRSEFFDSSIELTVKKANFTIRTVSWQGHNFFSTLRNKLMWGADIRN